MTKRERDTFESERINYEVEMSDQANRRRIADAVRTRLFPLVERNVRDTVREISQLCVIPEDRRRINSLLFEE